MGTHDRDIIAARVEREEQWAYDRRNERLSLRQIRELSARLPEEGGLGYPLSEQVLRQRIDAYFTRIRTSLQTGVDERRARQEAEIDELIRLAVADIRDARAAGDVKASAEAEARLLKYQEREAKIFGTDAPQRIEADVTRRDAVVDELDAMLARIGAEDNGG
mgnify:CR=1 FL=1